jgi:hypothetical protein
MIIKDGKNRYSINKNFKKNFIKDIPEWYIEDQILILKP